MRRQEGAIKRKGLDGAVLYLSEPSSEMAYTTPDSCLTPRTGAVWKSIDDNIAPVSASHSRILPADRQRAWYTISTESCHRVLPHRSGPGQSAQAP